jgi:hypothetical protein
MPVRAIEKPMRTGLSACAKTAGADAMAASAAMPLMTSLRFEVGLCI